MVDCMKKDSIKVADTLNSQTKLKLIQRRRIVPDVFTAEVEHESKVRLICSQNSG
jgi:hypothetical protein